MLKRFLPLSFFMLSFGAFAQEISAPVIIQPSESESMDAVVCNRTDMVDLNFGSFEYLQATGWTGNNVGSNNQDWRILINFPQIDTLSGKNKITLTLSDAPSQYFNQEGENASRIYLVTSKWEEGKVTWNTQPTFDPEVYVEVPFLAPGFGSVEIDLSKLVQKIKEEGRTNYGFLLKLVDEDPYGSLIFASSSNPTISLRPKLSITKESIIHPPLSTCFSVQPKGDQSIDAVICNRTDMVDLNFGNSENLQATGWTGMNVGSNDQDWRILIKFPSIDTVSSNKKVTLTLFDSPSQYFNQEGNNASRIYLVTSPWEEGAVTWNTQPTYDPTAFVDIPALSSGFDSVVVDITSLVAKLKAGGKVNYGFLLKLNNENPYGSLIFASGDALNASLHPRITICNEKIVTPPVGPCVQLQPAGTQSIDAVICNRTDMVDLNFGNSEYLQATGWTGMNVGSNDQDWRILIKFPSIDTVSSNKKVTLTLFDSPSQYFNQEGNNASRIYLVTSPWEEGAVTWNTQPTYDPAAFVDIPALSSGFDSVVVDITSLVAKLKAGGKINYGFLLKLNNENPYGSLIFASGDAPNTSLHPRITICNEKIVTPPVGPCVQLQPAGTQSIDAVICNRTDMVDLNFGNSENLQATGWTGMNVGSNNQDWRILIKFPSIDTVSSNKKVTLTLFDSPSQYFNQEGNNASRIYLVTSPWEEGAVTWNTQPTYDPAAFVDIPALSSGFDSVVVDITSLVAKLKAGGKVNYGFLLKLNNEDPYGSLIFASGDALNSKLHPRLTICKEEIVVTPPKDKIVVIQPTGNESIDAIICNRTDMVDLNFGNSEYLQATGWTGMNVGSNDQDWRILLKFPAIDTLSLNTKITLTLFDVPSQYFNQEGANRSRLYLVTENWEEGTVTWNNQPAYDPNTFIEIPSLSEGFDSVEVDLRLLVQKILLEGKPNFGFLLKLDSEDAYRSLSFASGDYPTSGVRPKLKIYSAPLVTGIAEDVSTDKDGVYPNPVNDKLFILGNAVFQSFSIMDVQGKVVLAGSATDAINVSTLKEGMYFIVLRHKSKTTSYKFIKE